MRWTFYQQKKFDKENTGNFYRTLYILLISLALGYGSLFLIGYVIVIGFPLVFLQSLYEKRNFHEYESMIHAAKTYGALQRKYFELVQDARDKKRGKK
jgi:hypothetical protein